MRSFVIVVMFLGGLAAQGTAQLRTLAGRVSDAVTGRPIAVGVVTVRGTGATDELRPDGVFVVRAPLTRVELVVRAPGYRTATVTVPIETDAVLARLEPDALRLEAIVVSGEAAVPDRRHAPAAVSAVDGDALTAVPAVNLKEALQGRVAGADVQRNSGAPGENLQVRLRGITSLLGSTAPLYVLDGIVVSDVAIGAGMGAVTGGQEALPGRLADLAMQDIARIEVLKGPAASLRYGPRAANGVIVIMTKRGARVNTVPK